MNELKLTVCFIYFTVISVFDGQVQLLPSQSYWATDSVGFWSIAFWWRCYTYCSNETASAPVWVKKRVIVLNIVCCSMVSCRCQNQRQYLWLVVSTSWEHWRGS